MPVQGTKIVANNILRFGGKFLATVNGTMKVVKGMLDKEVTRNISLQDHSLKELAKLDHPYALRHGSKGSSLHKPYWLVHKQSGKLLSSKKSGTVDAAMTAGMLTASAFVGLDEGTAPHALYVVYGTSKMIPRPVLTGSRNRVVGPAMELIKARLKYLTVTFR